MKNSVMLLASGLYWVVINYKCMYAFLGKFTLKLIKFELNISMTKAMSFILITPKPFSVFVVIHPVQ